MTAPDRPPISLAWSGRSKGDRPNQARENHPRKTYDGASYVNPGIGDGHGQLGFDFGNTAIAPKVNAQVKPRFSALAVHTRDEAIRGKE